MRVIINRSDAIGDTLLTLPMASKIKKEHPDARLIFIISDKTAPLFVGNPHIDELIIAPKKSRFKFYRELFYREQPTHYFYVGGDELPNLVAFLCRVPFRGGLRSRLSTYLYLNYGVRQKRSEAIHHESRYNLELLKPAGIIIRPHEHDEIGPKLYNIELSSQMNSKYIVVHPGMTGHSLNLPMSGYARIIEHLAVTHSVIISYTPSDAPYILKLKEELSLLSTMPQVSFHDGSKDGLRAYLSLLKGADLFIGPSTGTMHLANILNVPLITFFSPISVQHQRRWGPYYQNGNTAVISPDVSCKALKKCFLEECPDYFCMDKIDLMRVFSLSDKILKLK